MALGIEMSRPRVLLIGTGAAATTLGLALRRAGVEVLGLHGRDPARTRRAARRAGVPGTSGPWPETLASADVIWIAVADDAIAAVARRLSRSRRLHRRQVVLHASGALDGSALSPLAGRVGGTGSLHPLQSLADPDRAARRLAGATFAIEGTARARTAARALARALGGVAVPIATGAGKTLYHAAASLVSQGTVAVMAAALEALAAAGVRGPRAQRMLGPLLGGTVENIGLLGPARALTGPVARGDRGTLARHRAALRRRLPHLVPLFDAVVTQDRRLRAGRRARG